MAEFRYKAFISYSWADAAWGKWLHHAIETYRTPRQLVGSEGLNGPVPARLHPLFKDREEEAAGASIGAAVESALAGSEFLIVICSPHSVRSRWVDHEIAWFKAHRDPSRILALIVDGEPGGGERECFPRALTHLTLPDLTVTDQPSDAPLAADARPSGDGKRGARLKLAAALLGVGLDGLVRRDDRRRALRQRWITAGSLLFGGSMAALAWFAVQARQEADQQRAESDSLVEFMLTDLREKLEPVGRLDALDVVGQRALKYYAGQKPGNLDADALGRRSRALHLVGEVRNIRGDSAAGLAAFRQAAATTQELLARDPHDPQRIFDHAQSVFWVGYIAYERGENKEAEAQFREYKRLADRLVMIDPKELKWQLESSYAETNLGVMLFELRRYQEAEPAFALGLKRIEAVASAETYQANRQIELGTMLNWLGMTRSELAERTSALAIYRREVSIYEGILQRESANAEAKNRLAVALQLIGGEECDSGNLAAAIAAVDRSLALRSELRALEPGNTEWQEIEVRARLNQVEYYIYADRLREAEASFATASALLDRMTRSDPTNMIWARNLRSARIKADIRLALARGDLKRAEHSSETAVKLAGVIDDPSWEGQLLLSAGDAQQRLGRARQARTLWLQALDLLPRSPNADLHRYLVLRRLGRESDAAQLAAVLERRSFRHPAYQQAKQR